MKKTIVFGLSGLTKGLLENINNNYMDAEVHYIYIDKNYYDLDTYEGIPVIDDLSNFKYHKFIIPTFNHQLRKRWMDIADSLQMEPVNILHKDSYISKSVILGKGYFIGQENIIESNVTIGDFFLCGYKNRIGHDSIIGHYCHAYVMTNIGGFNKIGDNASLCSSSSTKENTEIGNNCIIGLGSVVFKNIPDNHTTLGNPARCIKNT